MTYFLSPEAYLTLNRIFIFLMIPLSLFIGGWVYLNNRREKLNQLFFLLSISIISFPVFGYLTFFADQPDISLFWSRWAYASGTFFLMIFYFFFRYFFKEEEKFKFLQIFLIIGGIFIICMSFFTNLIVKEIEVQEIGTRPHFGPGAYIFYIYAFIVFVFVFYRFYKNYLIASTQKKAKIQYFFLGTTIFLLLNTSFNVIIPVWRGTFEFHQFGNYAPIILLGFTAFAIVKRELFGMKVILTALLVGLIAILLLLDALIFTQDLFFQILKGIIFIIFLFFGYYLIKSVRLEIKRREELEELTYKLEKVNVELATAYKKLERLDKAKTEFLSIASHQLRTPLTAVKGYISMMMEKVYGKPPQKMAKPLKNIYESNERLIKLVNGLLNISRIEAGRIEMNIKELSLEKMIDDIIRELGRAVKEKNIYLKPEEVKDPLPKISVDEEKIRQAVTNIIDNAIKYTEQGGITVKLRVVDQKIQIIISDTGEGMTEEEISNLFVSFTRGKAGTKLWTEGAGLGLYIAKKFVEMHNGKVWAESQGKSRGSTFYIQLPIKSAEEKLMEKL